MKKLLSLFLCLLLLLCGCQKEEEPAPITGEFYTEGGFYQNTLVNLVITNTEFHEPLLSFRYKIYNETDFPVTTDAYYERLQCYENGEWINVFSRPIYLNSPSGTSQKWFPYEHTVKAYYPEENWTAGVYRFYVTCFTQYVEITPVAYFTVTQPQK